MLLAFVPLLAYAAWAVIAPVRRPHGRGVFGPARTSAAQLRRLDIAGLVLLLVGLSSGAVAAWALGTHDLSPLILLPAGFATFTGITHLTTLEAPRP